MSIVKSVTTIISLQIKGIADKMKNLSSYLTLSANQEGDLTLKVETDLVTVSTR